MSKKLILLNGAAGVGKTTIARMYTNAHPLTLAIDGDQVMGMIGAWRGDELKARELKFALIENMTVTHLRAGYDVVLPYLLTNALHAEVFENIAKENDAVFSEVILFVEKEEAVSRLLERGKWGEEGSKQLTKEDVPRIERLYDLMMNESAKRSNMIHIAVAKGAIKETYAAFLNVVGNA